MHIPVAIFRQQTLKQLVLIHILAIFSRYKHIHTNAAKTIAASFASYSIRELKQATFLTTRTPTENQSSQLVAMTPRFALLVGVINFAINRIIQHRIEIPAYI